ncbi:MAG: phosphotransferase [Desulfobacterales bacterium]|nr:MAG: phosphotransferase [Desulfobacterales bacterium]
MDGITAVEDIIKRVDIWDHNEVRYRQLSGGMTNHSYICHVRDKKYVLRIPGSGTDVFINRAHELSCAIAAAKAGASPDVLCVVAPEGAVVTPFIDGEVLHADTVVADDNRIAKIVAAVQQVHAKAVFEPVTHTFDLIRRYTQTARDVDAFFPYDFDWMCAIADKIEQAMERNNPPAVACHNDLFPENFIIDANGKLWILDWEYGGMNDPYFDLGDLAVEHPLTRKQEELVIQTYCGEVQPHRLYRILLHKLTADLRWSLWAMIQDRISKIDFDFYTYGLGRYARFRANYYHREFKTWLEGV